MARRPLFRENATQTSAFEVVNRSNNLTNGLVAAWPNGANGKLFDTVSDLDLNLGFPNVSGGSNFINSFFGNTLRLEAGNNKVYASSANSRLKLGGATELTVSIWVNPKIANQSNTGIIGCWGGNGYMLYLNPEVRLYINGSFVAAAGTALSSTDRWYHIVATWSGLQQKAQIYVDGNLVLDTSLAQTSINADSVLFSIGAYSVDAGNFNGQVALPCVWRRRLSASDIKSLNKNPWQLFGDTTRFINFGSVGGLTTVLKTVSPAYNVLGLVTNANSASYSVRQTSSNLFGSNYNVTQSVTRNSLSNYNIRQAAVNLSVEYYNVRQSSSITKLNSYNVRQTSLNTNSTNYFVRELVSNLLTPSYNVRQLSVNSRNQNYNIRQQSSASLNSIYQIFGGAAVGRSWVSAYNVRSAVSTPTSLSYQVLQSVQFGNTFTYVIRTNASSSKPQTFIVRAVSSNFQSSNFNVRQIVSSEKISQYNIVGVIPVGISRQIIYEILGEILNENLVTVVIEEVSAKDIVISEPEIVTIKL